MSKSKRERRGQAVPLWIGIMAFMLAFVAGVVSKVAVSPSWAKRYSVEWSDEVGTLMEDIAYAEGEANRFDLYLPKDGAKDAYGLVVYLHAGGFTSGDKADDRSMLSWLCSQGYVAAGINYTLFVELGPGKTNGASVLTQSNEIKAAVPQVIAVAQAQGYPIDTMAIAGGSAGHTLAMIYAYRDGAEAPVPVALTFGGVGPSCFYREDWDNYGFDQETEAAYQGCAGIFSAMLGEEITVDELKDGSYVERMKPISAAAWVTTDAPPTVVAYARHDRVQPFKASLRLKAALEQNGVDHVYLELPHSGHGLQNDNDVSKLWMEAIEAYLNKYMPVR